ncbi:outer membrane protein transport protein [Photobacterium sp. TY1-4]|uniref:outer membrane protein transport protein n=1 Tax=Photobacterium sp. TY1-4 TaxID=2899122 RepID=UPI0021BF7589|nr:outer membrane protein transport protein [Photobacterium sp. TY1-4]UXI00378.1 outer membrane protein transport protein [Photobacterium sp. TY1-4]
MSKKISLTAVAVTAALFSLNTQAAGFQVNEHSASGLGRAFAGETAIADNASVLARNPAAMARFERAEVSGSLSFIDPSIDIASKGSHNAPVQTYEDVAPFAIVPAGFFIQPINDQFAWGVGVFANYGFATEYPDGAFFGALAGNTDLITVNFNPNVSWRINDNFSVGGGVSLVYADAVLTRHFGSLNPANPSQELLKLEGDTWEWGWNVGALWELNDDHRFGLSYRSQVDLEFAGDFTDYSGTGVAGSTIAAPKKVGGDLTVVLPAIAEFGGFHQLNNQWALHYGVQWTQWSKFEELKATSNDCVNGVCLLKEEEFDDNFRYSIGATYTLSQAWILRAGFAFDEQAGKSTLSIPDTDRYWYSAGLTYNYSDDMTFDFGLTYLYGQSSDFNEKYVDGREYAFSGENDAILSAAQMNYRF